MIPDERRTSELDALREESRRFAETFDERIETDVPESLQGSEPSYPVMTIGGPVVATLRLGRALQRDGRRIATVSFREPIYAQVVAMLAGLIGRTALHAAMTGLTEAEIGSLQWSDAERVVRMCHVLMPDTSEV